LNFISLRKTSPEESGRIRLILIASIALSLITAKYYPLDMLNHFFPGLFREDSSCIMLNVTGMPCPFCGMSRAFGEFLHLDFSKSMYYNPSSVLFFTFSGIFCLTIFVLSFLNYKFVLKFNRFTLLVFIIALLTIWILNVYFGHH